MALKDLNASAVNAAIGEFDRIGRAAFLEKYGVGKARGFWLIHEGRAYDSKALAGAAHGYVPGHAPLAARDFSGGEQTVASVLTQLGFTVETPRATAELPTLDFSISPYEGGPSPPVRQIAGTGKSTLLRGDDYNRDNIAGTDRQKWFYTELGEMYRVTGSIELPVAFSANNGSYRLDAGNIGHAVAEGMFDGLEPDKLVTSVRLTPAFLQEYGRTEESAAGVIQDQDRVPIPDVNNDPGQHLVDPPSPSPGGRHRPVDPFLNNWAERDAANRRLGAAGEEWVVRYERARLAAVNQKGLANQVRHVSKEIGDGSGYDITSFDVDGSEIYIEVKTTKQGISTPFFISSHEVDVASQKISKFRLYRLFSFPSDPKLYIINGPLTEKCELMPASYRAFPL